MHSTQSPTHPPHSRWLRVSMLIASLACVGVLVLMFRQFGSATVLASVRRLGSLWPILIALELGRIVCEVAATRSLFGARAKLPWLRLVRGQLIGQMLDVLMPAGRTSAETAKAVVYARATGWPQALAVGTALQLAVIGANALWVFAGFCVSREYGLPHSLRAGLLGYALVTGSLVLGVALFAAAPAVRRHAVRFPIVQQSLERFAHLVVAVPGRLLSALLAQFVGRAIQALQLALIVTALGARPSVVHAYLTEAVYLVGAALGELVPAQLGTTDAVFVIAAPSLGLTAAAAFSVTLGLHAVQMLTAVLSGLCACGLWWFDTRIEAPADAAPAVPEPAAPSASSTASTPPVPPASPDAVEPSSAAGE